VLTRFLIHIVALLFVFYVVWGIRGGNLWLAVVMALILAVVNTIIRPVLLILNVHFAVGFGLILIGYLIYVIISTVLTRVL
jgi:uncharacterized membrane protein YvlD (DUF360 family)